MPYRLVLAGTDGSESSLRAVERAAEIAIGSGATLLLVTAYHPLTEREREQMAAQLRRDAYKVAGTNPAQGILELAGDRAVAVGAQDVRVEAVDGEPVDVLVEVAERARADLVVVGNRGFNSLTGRLLGSVPQNVSHKARCDVLIVHTTG